MGRNKITDFNRIPSFIANLGGSIEKGLEEMGEETVDQIDAGFDSGRDALGRPWEPLSPETISKKSGGQILVEDGDFRESFDYKVDKKRLTITSESPLIHYHELGTQNMPSRPVLEPAAAYTEQNIREHMGESVDRAYKRSAAGGAASSLTVGGGGGLLGGLL